MNLRGRLPTVSYKISYPTEPSKMDSHLSTTQEKQNSPSRLSAKSYFVNIAKVI